MRRAGRLSKGSEGSWTGRSRRSRYAGARPPLFVCDTLTLAILDVPSNTCKTIHCYSGRRSEKGDRRSRRFGPSFPWRFMLCGMGDYPVRSAPRTIVGLSKASVHISLRSSRSSAMLPFRPTAALRRSIPPIWSRRRAIGDDPHCFSHAVRLNTSAHTLTPLAVGAQEGFVHRATFDGCLWDENDQTRGEKGPVNVWSVTSDLQIGPSCTSL